MWKKISKTISILLSCVCLVGAVGCDGMDWLTNIFNKTSQKEEIADYSVQEYLLGRKAVNAADTFETNFSDSGKEDVLTSDEVEKLKNDKNFSNIKVDEAEALNQGKEVVYKKKTAQYGMEDLSYWGATNNITYPGALLKIDQSGTALTPLVGLEQKPVTLSLGLEGATGVDYQRETAKDVTQSSVGACISKLVKGFLKDGAQLPYVISMQLTEIKAKEEINAALGLSFNVGSYFNMDGEFDFKNKSSKTYAILTLKQIYYTVNVDYKSSLGAYSLLGDNVTLEQVKAACPENFSPVYVSSVSYGRIAAITLKTEESFQSLRAGLNMTGGYGPFDAEIETKIEQKAESGSFEYNCFVYGGSVEGNQSVLSCKTMDKMLESLNQPYDPTKQVGLPISYQLSHIADNASARVGFVGDYYYADYIDTVRGGMEDYAYSGVLAEEYTVEQWDKEKKWTTGGAAMIAAGESVKIDLSKVDVRYIKKKGLKLKIQVALDIYEESDGQQELILHNKYIQAKDAEKGKDKWLAYAIEEHGGSANKPCKEKYRYLFTFIIDPNNIIDETGLILVFDAKDGDESSDKWYAQQIEWYVGTAEMDFAEKITYYAKSDKVDLLTEEKPSSFEEVLNAGVTE